jgi:hypothetical protein
MSDVPGYLLGVGDARRIPLPDKSVDLVIGSPPYTFARTYGIGAQRDCRSWVRWMLGVTAEAVRVSRGLVLWVVAGQTRDHCYEPSPEGLLWEWWSKGVGSGVYLDGIELPRRTAAECQCWRPCFWHRVGIPGSGGKKWLRADVEYVLAFKGKSNDFFTDNTAMGHPPKWAPGGEMSHRLSDGTKRNQWGSSVNGRSMTARNHAGELSGSVKPSHKIMYRRDASGARQYTKRTLDGTMESQTYVSPVMANPGNFHEWDFAEAESAWLEESVIHAKVGGGQLGSDLAHESEAPFPESLVEFFVRSFSPPGGLILDPFSGSGTTCAVAVKNDRRAIGLDLRRSQSELGHRRIVDGLRPRSPLDPPKPTKPLDGQGDLFAAMETLP